MVPGLRNEGASRLEAAGAEVDRGTRQDLESPHSEAANADGVIQAARSQRCNFAANCEKDRRAIETLGAGQPATEGVSATGVNASVVRLPQVHDTRKQGLITIHRNHP